MRVVASRLWRVVTGTGPKGASRVVARGPALPRGPPLPEPLLRAPGGDPSELHHVLYHIWEAQPQDRHTDELPVDEDDSRAHALVPPPGGALFRYFVLPPRGASTSDAELRKLNDEFFEAVGVPGPRHTGADPGMHRTSTLDFVVFLSGERVSLVLGDSEHSERVPLVPFDAVVQRATSHSWVNEGEHAALFAAVLIDDPAAAHDDTAA